MEFSVEGKSPTGYVDNLLFKYYIVLDDRKEDDGHCRCDTRERATWGEDLLVGLHFPQVRSTNFWEKRKGKKVPWRDML